MGLKQGVLSMSDLKNSKKYNFDLGVFIGRFQPFHLGHLYSIVEALKSCEKLLILIGSAHRARNIRNPWIYEERLDLLKNNLKTYDQEHQTNLSSRIFFEGLKDYLYDDLLWIQDVKNSIHKNLKSGQSVAIVGFEKDHSTYYLKLFPEYGRIFISNFKNLNSTGIRQIYFIDGRTDLDSLPKPTQLFLKNYLENAQTRPEYLRLQEEYDLILNYKKAWAHTPYPPIFVTTDAVVICQEHILLVKRKYPPGKNLWATPGGFLEVTERTEQGLFRELIEETQIKISPFLLKQSLVQMKLFDHPERCQVGRVITHAGLINLELSECPEVKANDDALLAQWWKLSELNQIEDQMHDDHYQIIQSFLSSLRTG